MNIEQLKELLDRIGNKVNLLHQAKLKRKVVQAFIDLLEDKQNMVIFFEEYSKKSIEIEKQNKRYREALDKIEALWKNATESTDDRQLTWLMYNEAMKALEGEK